MATGKVLFRSIAAVFLALFFIPYAYISLPLAWVVMLPFRSKLSRLAQWERHLLLGLCFIVVSLLVITLDTFVFDQFLARNVNTPMFQFLAMQTKELSDGLKELSAELRAD